MRPNHTGFSNDRRHDSYLTQKFIDLKLKWIKENIIDTGQENFDWYALQSDNAAGHFKNSKTLHFLTTLPRTHPWIKKQTHGFGAPGHGKGVWDGVGAAIKNGLRRDIVDGYCLDDLDSIQLPHHCYRHIRAKVTDPEWLKEHATYALDEYVPLWVDRFDRARVEDVYTSIEGIRRHRSFMVRDN